MAPIFSGQKILSYAPFSTRNSKVQVHMYTRIRDDRLLQLSEAHDATPFTFEEVRHLAAELLEKRNLLKDLRNELAELEARQIF